MSGFKLLIVEDDEQDLDACRDTVTRYIDEKQCDINLVECKSVDDAFKKLDNTYDAAIIDLKLAEHGDEGNKVIQEIFDSRYRIPIAILTGTPSVADPKFTYIGTFTKGETGYREILDRFWAIHNTGLTKIMGGRGLIENTLYNVFEKNLLPQRDKWIEYGEINPAKTEKALLRHTVNHLLQLLDDDEERHFPEEVYLSPPMNETIRTGSVVKIKDADQLAMVITPACDLAIRNGGKCKTDHYLLIEIEEISNITELSLKGIVKEDKKKKKLASVFGNNHTDYYHWLPGTHFFPGGFLNFRKLISVNCLEFCNTYEKPDIQISPFFLKDIISRFSSYYARQGQPDIEYNGYIKLLLSST